MQKKNKNYNILIWLPSNESDILLNFDELFI